jgi:hypothetical protein
MALNLDNKTRAYGTLILFGILAAVFWYFSDQFADWTSNSNPLLAMIVSIVLNPSYILLIYWLYKEYSFRGIIAGILISISIDIISLAHSIRMTGILPTDSISYSYADTQIYKIMYPMVHSSFGVFFLYVIIPTLFVYLSLRVIRKTSSFNRITKEAI